MGTSWAAWKISKRLGIAIVAGLVIAVMVSSAGVAAVTRTKAPVPLSTTTSTGSQNPRFRVRVSITPTHPTVGQTVIARFTITNTTQRTLRGEWQFTFSTPDSGIGAAVAGPLRPGVIAGETLRQKVTATTPDGRYIIYAEASNRRGSSHAKAHATFESPDG